LEEECDDEDYPSVEFEGGCEVEDDPEEESETNCEPKEKFFKSFTKEVYPICLLD